MWNKIRIFFRNIREFIWPLLDIESENKPTQITIDNCAFPDTEIDFILQHAIQCLESEEKRKNEVESKSTIFIGSLGVATAILLAVTKDMIFNTTVTYSLFRLLLIVMLTLSIIYISRSVWFSIKALERKNYVTVGFPNYMISNSEEKKRRLIVDYYNILNKNFCRINEKVDYMTMAQVYFKRSIFVIALYSIVTFMSYILSYNNLGNNILNFINSLTLNIIVGISITVLLLIALILIGVLFRKVKILNAR